MVKPLCFWALGKLFLVIIIYITFKPRAKGAPKVLLAPLFTFSIFPLSFQLQLT